MPRRLIEIDALRGLAIVLMVIYHIIFMLSFFNIIDFDILGSLAFEFHARVTQFLFLGLVGVSIHFSSRNFSGQLRRGAFIMAAAFLISLVTYVVVPEDYVRFGILHFIAVAIPVTVLFKGRPKLTLLAVAFSFVLGYFFKNTLVESIWLFPFGLHTSSFQSVDYFPLFPWLVLPLIGLYAAEFYYKERKATSLKFLGSIPGFVWMGKRSFIIYLVHVPIIYGVILLVSEIS